MKIKGEVQIPSLPNFITVLVLGHEVKVGVEELTEEELRECGRKWTEALVEHARKKREGEK